VNAPDRAFRSQQSRPAEDTLSMKKILGVYIMEGILLRLPGIMELKKKYKGVWHHCIRYGWHLTSSIYS
jgi:hypothetical protein